MTRIAIILSLSMVFLFFFLLLRSNSSLDIQNSDTNSNLDVETISNNSPSDENWKPFLDKREGYKLFYPGDWTLTDHSSSMGMIRADFNKGEIAGVQIRILKNISTNFESFADSYLNQFINQMKGHWHGDIDIISQEFTDIGNYDGFIASLVFRRQDGQDWFFKEFLWNRGSYVMVFQAGIQYEERYLYEDVLDKIAGSVDFQE